MLKGDTIYLRMLNAEDWEKPIYGIMTMLFRS